jgi:hypothetical protein
LIVYRAHRTFVPFAAVAASTAFVACHRSDSILLVEVAGDLTLHPATLQVTVTAGADTRSFQIPSTAGAAIDLPASFSLELSPSLTGPISISIEADDATGFVIGRGSTTQQDIDVGGQTVVAVSLVEVSGGVGDAGDGSDAADDGGAGGLGGSSGAGGAGGRGGTGGSAGAAGRAGSGGTAGSGGAASTGGTGAAGATAGSAGRGGAGGSAGGGAGAGGRGGIGGGGAAGSTASAELPNIDRGVARRREGSTHRVRLS